MNLRVALAAGCLLAACPDGEAVELVRLSVPEDPWLLGPLADGPSRDCRIGGNSHVVFASHALHLVADDRNASEDVFVRDLASGALERVSVDSQGQDAPGDSRGGDIDALGRHVVFESFAALDIGAGSAATSDVYLRDRATGTTRLLSRRPGTFGEAGSHAPRINPSGTHVVFHSHSSTLVPEDTNACSDIYLYVIATDTLTRVSTTATGAQANGCSYDPDISDDGHFIVFESDATNLVANDTNFRRDVFRKDLLSGEVIRLSESEAGIGGDRHSQSVTIGADGQQAAFSSSARNLLPDDSNLQQDIFLWTAGGTPPLRRVNLPDAGGQSNHISFDPVLARDGSLVAYQSFASNLVPGQMVGIEQPFIADLTSGQQHALLTEAGTAARRPSLGGDGLWSCVESASALDPIDGNGSIVDVFLHEQASGSWWLQSLASPAVPLSSGNGDSLNPDISADGRFVVFDSLATTLSAESVDTHAGADIHWLDLATGVVERHPRGAGDTLPNGPSTAPVVSADGRLVAFSSRASNLSVSDGDTRSDIYRLDRLSGELLHLSQAVAPGSGDSDQAHISADGERVVFRSTHGGLVAGDGNGVADIFLWRSPGVVERLSLSDAGSEGDAAASLPRLSADGSHAVFVSAAQNLDADVPPSGLDDVYLRDIDAATTLRVSQTASGHAADGPSSAADVSGDGAVVALISEAANLAPGSRPGARVLRWTRADGLAVDVSQSLPVEYTVQPQIVRISADARFVVFLAWRQIGSAFVDDLWRHDVVTGELLRVTRRADDSAHLGVIVGIAIDADGSHAVFDSDDDGLLPDDFNGFSDVSMAEFDTPAGPPAVFADGFESP